MKSTRKKAGIVAAALSGAVLIGGGALAFADTTPTPTPGSTISSSATPEKDDTGTEKKGEGKEGGETAFAGTIKAPAETNETEAADGSPEEKAQDQAETDALAKLATVTEQEASKAATDLVPGTISSIELDDEDGFVVWEVDITQADGTMVEVLVDAGDVSITALEVEDADEADIFGTIKAPAETEEAEAADGGPEELAQDKAETDALAKLATVSEQEATKAASDAVPGTVSQIQLDDEDGFVVWEADVTQADGTVVEVLIDAGDASVLAQETA